MTSKKLEITKRGFDFTAFFQLMNERESAQKRVNVAALLALSQTTHLPFSVKTRQHFIIITSGRLKRARKFRVHPRASA